MTKTQVNLDSKKFNIEFCLLSYSKIRLGTAMKQSLRTNHDVIYGLVFKKLKSTHF